MLVTCNKWVASGFRGSWDCHKCGKGCLWFSWDVGDRQFLFGALVSFTKEMCVRSVVILGHVKVLQSNVPIDTYQAYMMGSGNSSKP